MSIIDISLAKLHLRVTEDDEDTIIQIYLDAAERSAADYLDRSVVETTPVGDTDIVMNDPIKAACLLMLGHLYANREAIIDTPNVIKELPMGVKFLLDPYRLGIGV
jgi:uncharacterized phage protein (predicted DNA packaging)